MKHDYNQLFADLATEGLMVNNLFQLPSGAWRCNLRKDRPGTAILYAFGEGPNPYLAVIASWSKLEIDKGEMTTDRPPSVYNGPDVGAQIDKTRAQRTLEMLGLKRKPTFTAGLL